MTLPQMFSASVGTLIALISVIVFFHQPTRRFKAMFWFAVGLAMVFAGFQPHVIEYLGEDTLELRLRIVVALLSFIVLTVTLEAIRVGRMQERYAFLWLVTGLILLLGALFDDLAMLIPRLTGLSLAATVMVIVFAFVMLLLFYLSVALSTLQIKVFQIARELALAEERVRRLEGDATSQGGSTKGPQRESADRSDS
jgi:hypothetical protein